jgi:hypothetical protein
MAAEKKEGTKGTKEKKEAPKAPERSFLSSPMFVLAALFVVAGLFLQNAGDAPADVLQSFPMPGDPVQKASTNENPPSKKQRAGKQTAAELEADEEGAKTYTVIVPEGATAGAELEIQNPGHTETMIVVVPEGKKAGDKLVVPWNPEKAKPDPKQIAKQLLADRKEQFDHLSRDARCDACKMMVDASFLVLEE